MPNIQDKSVVDDEATPSQSQGLTESTIANSTIGEGINQVFSLTSFRFCQFLLPLSFIAKFYSKIILIYIEMDIIITCFCNCCCTIY